ncbi:unnamed protein product [Blepharisma stoltei]|uniref:Uncharacterized protein n=1 Tax=Blepharisma stoltei TaxID=1481888 RepID=A0AAU9JN84_9CILI|nr:unnamed protein product [Blepharisma stoltei]
MGKYAQSVAISATPALWIASLAKLVLINQEWCWIPISLLNASVKEIINKKKQMDPAVSVKPQTLISIMVTVLLVT